MRFFFFVFPLFAFVLHASCSPAYDELGHQEINRLAVQNLALGLQGLDLNAHLDRTIGLRLNSTVDGQRLNRHITLAGPSEDEPFLRSLNHFHDPTKEIDEAGLPWLPGVSAIQWALNTGGVQDDAWGGNYSWPAARRYFLKGLTGYEYDENSHQYVLAAATPAEREEALANAFRAIGQVMHLVADMSVPAHVRSDPHLPWDKDPYEVWAEDHYDEGANHLDEAIAGGLRIVTPELLGSPGILPLFDADRAVNSNAADPQQVFQVAPVGLSEFTNANFVSSDTMFQGYAFPTTGFLQVPQLLPAGTGVADYWGYPLTEVDGTGNPLVVDRFVRATYLGSQLGPQNSMSITYNPDIALTLDDDCLEAHARILFPRAVAYAAGVLEHFFRYELEIGIPYGASSAGFSYRILRSGTKDTGNPGIEANSASGQVLIFGVTASGDLTLIGDTRGQTIWGPVGERVGSDRPFLSTECFERYLYVFDGWIDGAEHVLATYVDSEMSITPSVAGRSIADGGFRANLVRPKSGRCSEDQPASIDILSWTLCVQGIREDGGTDDLGCVEDQQDWAAPMGKNYREYRIRFEGEIRPQGGTPTWARYEKHYGELVNEMSPVLQELTCSPDPYHSIRSYDTGNGHLFYTHSLDYESQLGNLSLANGLMEDVFSEQCDRPPAFNCLCWNDYAVWETGAEGGNYWRHTELPILGSGSAISIGISSLSEEAGVGVTLHLREVSTGIEVDLGASFNVAGAHEVTLGSLRPDLFTGGEKYQMWAAGVDGYLSFVAPIIDFGGCKTIDDPGGRYAERSGAVDYIQILP